MAADGRSPEGFADRRTGIFSSFPLPTQQQHRKQHLSAAVLDVGLRFGRAGVELGARVHGAVREFFRKLPVPVRLDEGLASADWVSADLNLWSANSGASRDNGNGAIACEYPGGLNRAYNEPDSYRNFGRPQGNINITSSFDSRTNDIRSSFVARGDIWRAEASYSGLSSRNNNPLFLIQLGPVLLARNASLLFPIHLSEKHLIWYGFDRKNGMHSLCPALWSKNRKWLLSSMFCLNSPSCSFMDIHFPNGQLTYVMGDGFSTRVFVNVFGGLIQAQGHLPGDICLSYSFKNSNGPSITPIIQLPEMSFSVQVAQALAWKRSGLMLRPSTQVSLCPTIGGSHPGFAAEVAHSVNENVGIACGCSHTSHPSAFTSVSIGRSKLNGNVASSGIVIKVEAPLSTFAAPSLSVQLNGGLEF